jgi:hypothetical protein
MACAIDSLQSIRLEHWRVLLKRNSVGQSIQPFFDANTGERKPRRMGVEYSPVGVSHLARLVHMLQRAMVVSRRSVRVEQL